ncbi:hypothetical protein KC887_07610 [Candidatus Kaiserbacteria bacterium]|nr:hypothetical protein [Candidatus Kaiserbacteria bacterium]
MKYTYTTLAILLFCGLLPQSAAASGATLVGDNVVVFTLDFAINNPLYINELPIAASSEVGYTDVVDTIGVAITDNTGTKAKGTTKAILLSTEPIVGTHYKLTASTSPKFTLLMITTFDEPVTADYHARITKLPYWMDGHRTSVHQNQLDEFPTVTFAVK